jgi:hypothetical protein
VKQYRPDTITVGGLNDDVIVLGHHTVCMTAPMAPFVDVLKGVEKVQAILVVLENGLFFIAA